MSDLGDEIKEIKEILKANRRIRMTEVREEPITSSSDSIQLNNLKWESPVKELDPEKKKSKREHHVKVLLKFPDDSKMDSYMLSIRAQQEDKTNKIVFHKFQHEIMEMLDYQNDRQILYVHDARGNSGKTILTRYLEMNGFQVFMECTAFDITERINPSALGYIINILRNEKDPDYWVAEHIKDRVLYTDEGKTKYITTKHPKVVIFSHEPLPENAITRDRIQLLTRNIDEIYYDDCGKTIVNGMHSPLLDD